MVSLIKKFNFKRIIALFLLCCILGETIITSNTQIVYADSNSRRSTNISLAQSASFNDIDLDDIDVYSLQTIAVYLSNFYIPFITVLDGNYTSDEEVSGNTQHVESMREALITNCGFDKDVAEFLVDYVCQESLDSCKSLYVTKDDLVHVMLANASETDIAIYSAVSLVDGAVTWAKGVLTYDDVDESDGTTTTFWSGLANTIKKSLAALTLAAGSLFTNLANFFSGGVSEDAPVDREELDSIAYNARSYAGLNGGSANFFDNTILAYKMGDYYKYANRITVNGTTYVQVSYALFLEMMGGYGYSNTTEGSIAGFVSWFTNSLLDDISGVSTDDDYEGDIKFYCVSNGTANVVFDNSDACMQAFCNVVNGANLNQGYGSAFASIQDTDIAAIDDPTISEKALVTSPNMYVNWEGSLVFDNGAYRTIVLPGCCNPYMICSIDGTVGTEIPLTNVYGIEAIEDGRIQLQNDGANASKQKDKICVTVDAGDYSWFTLNHYRIITGSSEQDFDDSWTFGWGKHSDIGDLFNSSSYLSVADSFGGDYVYFPNFKQYKSKKMSSGDNSTFSNKIFGTSYLIYFDDDTPINEDTDVTDIFKAQDLLDSEFMTKLSASLVDAYASFSDVRTQGQTHTYSSETKALFQSIFVTYCWAEFNYESYKAGSTSFDVNTNIANLRFNFDSFPTVNMTIDWSTIQKETMEEETLSFVYYLLHPTKGIAYVATLIKNKVAGVLIGWHEDIVGSSDSNSSTGMTQYLGTSSYTTVPSLRDVSWVSNILDIYNSIIVYIIIALCLIMLCYILTGAISVQRAIIGVLMFSLLAFIPPYAINATVDTANKFSDTTFSAKFDYWALCQLQTYLLQYDEANAAREEGNESDTMGTYAAFVLSMQAVTSDGDGGTSETSYSGVKLKWLTPKKYNSMASVYSLVQNTSYSDSSAEFLKTMLFASIADATSGETYIDSDNALYLYRDYSDIYDYAYTSYNIMSTYNFSGVLRQSSGNATNILREGYVITMQGDDTVQAALTDLSDTSYYNYVLGNTHYVSTDSVYRETSSIMAISRGFLYDTTGGSTSTYYTDATGDITTTLATSYVMNYTSTASEIHTKYERLNEVLSGNATIKINDTDNTYYNFGLTKSTLDYSESHLGEGAYGSFLAGYQEIKGFEDSNIEAHSTVGNKYETSRIAVSEKLSDVFYGLYSESTFYYFNNNVRDQLASGYTENGYGIQYITDVTNLAGSNTTGDSMNSLARLWLADNQTYFYNLEDEAGDGYGELRDFMNMHDLFYYVIPYLREGVELARLYDDTFGLYIDEDVSLSVQPTGVITYDGVSYDSIRDLDVSSLNEEQQYKLWHTYNTYTILSAYTPWIDTMLDCNYAKEETISIMGDKFVVEDPLDPTTYYQLDDQGNITKGRYMVFSRSEMEYYGLDISDLTTVEYKIITLQDNVYEATLDLMNYYTLSDEVMIHAYAMIQTFEFNKIFSQTSVIGDDYVLYPQGYELKAFSYDAYLRLILAESSGEDLMTDSDDENESIYTRIAEKTSLFFCLFLLLNDVIAVYIIPGLKLFFIIFIFFTSILFIIAAAIKIEMNLLNVIWKSFASPLLSFAAISMGMSLLTSMFMSDGADGVVQTAPLIDVGDPTSVLIIQIVINAGAVILYWKLCKKAFTDCKTYLKAVFENAGAAVVGGIGSLGALAAGVAMGRGFGGRGSGRGRGNGRGNGEGTGTAKTPKQRGADNSPTSGKDQIAIDDEKHAKKLEKERLKDEKAEARYNKKSNQLADKAGNTDGMANAEEAKAKLYDENSWQYKHHMKKSARLKSKSEDQLNKAGQMENYRNNVSSMGRKGVKSLERTANRKAMGEKIKQGGSRLKELTKNGAKNTKEFASKAAQGTKETASKAAQGAKKVGRAAVKAGSATIKTAGKGAQAAGKAVGTGIKSIGKGLSALRSK